MKNTVIKGIGVAASLIGLVVVTGCGGGGGNGGNSRKTYTQLDRLSRPVVNEVFASVANDRHQINDQANPTDDKNELAKDIQSFMLNTAGRSQATANAVTTVLVGTTGDVMKADLSQNTTKAAYLGVETSGATGSAFGGRALTDDVVDASLGIVFGNTVSKLGLAPDDGKEIPTLATDNVGDGAKHFTNTFPYLGAPR